MKVIRKCVLAVFKADIKKPGRGEHDKAMFCFTAEQKQGEIKVDTRTDVGVRHRLWHEKFPTITAKKQRVRDRVGNFSK